MTVEPSLHRAIEDVVIRYATGIDTRDWELLHSCFTPKVDADYGDIGHWTSADELVEWMRTAHEGLGHTMHRMMNVAVRHDESGVHSRAYVDAIVMFPGNQQGVRASGFYEDHWADVDGWRIARRTFTSVLIEPVGTPPAP